MNKKQILALISLSSFALAGAGMDAAVADAGAEQQLVGVLDTEKVMSESKAAEKLRKAIEAKREKFQQEVTGFENVLRKEEEALSADQDKISKEAFEKRRADFEQKVNRMRQAAEERQGLLKEGYEKNMVKLQETIKKIVSDKAKARKINIVLTKAIALHNDEKLDLTADVVSDLNQQLPDLQVNLPDPKVSLKEWSKKASKAAG